MVNIYVLIKLKYIISQTTVFVYEKTVSSKIEEIHFRCFILFTLERQVKIFTIHQSYLFVPTYSYIYKDMQTRIYIILVRRNVDGDDC